MRTEPSARSFHWLGLDRRLVGQFLVQPLEQLLARDLGGEHGAAARRRSGPPDRATGPRGIVLGEPALAGRRRRRPSSAEIMKVALELALLVARLRPAPAAFALATRSILLRIEDLRLPHLGELRRGCASASSSMPSRASISSADHVGVVRAAPGGRHHGAVEPPLRREDAGRVDEDDLRVALDRDAAHERARRLHLVRDDRDLGADQRVDQRRLAGIRRADQRDEAAARRSVCLASVIHRLVRRPTPSRVSMAAAAACSAARFERPLPSAGALVRQHRRRRGIPARGPGRCAPTSR